MKKITLREVCEMVGVSRRAIQGYEKNGLVQPIGKNKYGYLLYDEVAIEKISTIKMYQDMGFSVKEIKQLYCLTEEERKECIAKKLVAMYIKLEHLKFTIAIAEELLA